MSSTKDKPVTHFFFEEVYEGENHEITCRKVGSIQNDKGEYEVVYSGLKQFKGMFKALLQNDQVVRAEANVIKLNNTFQDKDLYVIDEVILEREGHGDYVLSRVEKEQLFVQSGLLIPGTYAPPMKWLKAKMEEDEKTCDEILERYQEALMPRFTLDESIEIRVVDAVGG